MPNHTNPPKLTLEQYSQAVDRVLILTTKAIETIASLGTNVEVAIADPDQDTGSDEVAFEEMTREVTAVLAPLVDLLAALASAVKDPESPVSKSWLRDYLEMLVRHKAAIAIFFGRTYLRLAQAGDTSIAVSHYSGLLELLYQYQSSMSMLLRTLPGGHVGYAFTEEYSLTPDLAGVLAGGSVVENLELV